MKKSSRLFPVLMALTLMEWGGIFLYFYLGGRLNAFLHPIFQPWVLVAGILMVATAVVTFWNPEEQCGHFHLRGGCCGPEDGDIQTGVPWSKCIKAAVLMVPIILAVVFSPDHYGANVLQNRKAITASADLPGSYLPKADLTPAGPVAVVPPKDPTSAPVNSRTDEGKVEDMDIMDLIYASGADVERERLEGKTISVLGQFSRDRNPGVLPGDFGLYRLIIVCCAADARPVSVRIAAPDLKGDFKNTDWIRVTGPVHFTPAGDSSKPVPVLDAKSVVPAETPADAMSFTP